MREINEKDIIIVLRLMDLYKLNDKNTSYTLLLSVHMWYNFCTKIIRLEVKKRIEKKIRNYKNLMKKSNKWFYLNGNFTY